MAATKKRRKSSGVHSIKFILVSVIIGVTLVTSIGLEVFSLVNTIKTNAEQTEAFKNRILEDVKDELKHETEIAVSVIEEVHQKQEAGELTEEQAKKEAANRVRELRYNDGAGYFWVDTYEGINVVLLGRDTEGQSRWDATDPNGTKFIQEMIANGKQQGGGYTNLMFAKPNETEPLPKMNFTMAYEPYQWVLGTGVWIDHLDAIEAEYVSHATAALRTTIIQSIIFLVVLIVLLVIFALYIGNRIANPIKFLTDEIERMASGDFTIKENADQQKKMEKDKTEIGTMSDAEITLHQSIRELMEKISETTNYVASASEELTASAGQAADASEMVAESCTNVAGSCSDQMNVVNEANDEVAVFAENMDEFSTTIEKFGEAIRATNDAASTGSTEINKAMGQMDKIQESVSATSEVVESLGGQLQTIGSIVDTISDIAEQTNLLSLNASIEAARAGEAGKGFAVVADEIRKLADQSNGAAGQITELINSIQAKSDEAVTAMAQGLSIVKSGSEVVGQSGSTFNEIVTMVSNVSEQADRMNQIVGQLTSGTDRIKDAIERIDNMSRDVAEETGNVSAASEEQTASAHEIAEASGRLATEAQELQAFVKRFTL
ncbi:MAG: cache domain-containing protein [Lachnospiraceae bacterium]|nr:cache domain-containing protein [Lachnospiraceae bacterium]